MASQTVAWLSQAGSLGEAPPPADHIVMIIDKSVGSWVL